MKIRSKLKTEKSKISEIFNPSYWVYWAQVMNDSEKTGPVRMLVPPVTVIVYLPYKKRENGC